MVRTQVEILHDQCRCVTVLLESRIESQNDLGYLVEEQLLLSLSDSERPSQSQYVGT